MSSVYRRSWNALAADSHWLFAAARSLEGEARQEFAAEGERFVAQLLQILVSYELEHFEDDWLEHEPDADDPGGVAS